MENFEQEILNKKEYLQFKILKDYDFTAPENILAQNMLQLQSFQLIAANIMNPHSPIKSCIIKYATGSGKTLTAIAITQPYIEIYKEIRRELRKFYYGARNQQLINSIVPSIIVLGFGGTEIAFKNDMLKYPELGYITREELDELNALKVQIMRGNLSLRQTYKSMESNIRSRITNRNRGGYYSFYGYQEFYNKLFSSDTDLVSLVGSDVYNSSTIIERAIKDGKISYSQIFHKRLSSSFIICDECHELYNVSRKNNYGLMLRYIVDKIKNIRVIYLSATPINSVATEVIDLLQLTRSPIRYEEVFDREGKILNSGLNVLAEHCRNRFLYVKITDMRHIPAQKIVGETLKYNGSELPYLKFIPCALGENHKLALQRFNARREMIDEFDDDRITHTIYDMVFPTPNDDTFNVVQIQNLHLSPPEWIAENNLQFSNKILSGPILNVNRIGKYSNKYKKLIEHIIDNYRVDGGKILIYHNRVRTTGVLLIEQILLENGIISEHGEILENTLCIHCGEQFGTHTNNHNPNTKIHTFVAARYIVAHGLMEQSKMTNSFLRYNSPANTNGEFISILLGSRIIKQSYDFKTIRNMYILSCPTSISILLQLFGRAIRLNSHSMLPAELRTVIIKIFVSTHDIEGAEIHNISELAYWASKLQNYVGIQTVDKIIHTNALDSDLNYNIVNPPPIDAPPDLGILGYEPRLKTPGIDNMDKSSFIAHGHWRTEINNIIIIIKKLFMLEPIWKFADLIREIHNPPFALQYNARLIDDKNIISALNILLQKSVNFANLNENMKYIELDYLLSPNNIYFYSGGVKYKLTQIEDYFIRDPIDVEHLSSINSTYEEFIEQTRDEKQYYFMGIKDKRYMSLLDADNYINPIKPYEDIIISVNNITKFTTDRLSGVLKARTLSDTLQFPVSEQIDAIQHCIDSIINGMSSKSIEHFLGLYENILLYRDTYAINNVYINKYNKYDLPRCKYIGYKYKTNYKVWHPTLQWVMVPAGEDRDLRGPNNIIIGIIENGKFKIQRRDEMIKKNYKEDIRKIYKGIVCSTIPKQKVSEYIKLLGHNVQGVRQDLCNRLYHILLEKDKTEKDRYFYFWWDS